MNKKHYIISKQKLNKNGEIIKNARRKIVMKMHLPDSMRAISDALAYIKCCGDKQFRYEVSEALRWKHLIFIQWNEQRQKWEEVNEQSSETENVLPFC